VAIDVTFSMKFPSCQTWSSISVKPERLLPPRLETCQLLEEVPSSLVQSRGARRDGNCSSVEASVPRYRPKSSFQFHLHRNLRGNQCTHRLLVIDTLPRSLLRQETLRNLIFSSSNSFSQTQCCCLKFNFFGFSILCKSTFIYFIQMFKSPVCKFDSLRANALMDIPNRKSALPTITEKPDAVRRSYSNPY